MGGTGRLRTPALVRLNGKRSGSPAERSGVALPQNLMHPLSCKPIEPVPKLANRTPLALVINSLLVRTANYAIGHRDGSHVMRSDKFKYLAGDAWIGADVTMIH